MYNKFFKGKEESMAKYTVSFDIREGSKCVSLSTTVEAESDYMAVQLAEAKLKAANPSWIDRAWLPKRVSKN